MSLTEDIKKTLPPNLTWAITVQYRHGSFAHLRSKVSECECPRLIDYVFICVCGCNATILYKHMTILEVGLKLFLADRKSESKGSMMGLN